MRILNRLSVFALPVMASIAVIGCGGGDKSTTPPPPATYTIGGTVSGLTGAGLVLQDNGSNNLTVSANATSFTFATSVKSGSAYSVTVLTQPASQNCTVTGGSGTATANVSSVGITCVTAYTIGGSVYGLSATGLVLQDNSGNDLTVSAGASSYAFVFTGAIPTNGAPYSITVKSNPSGQACTVANPIGTATANVTNANVSCTSLAATTYTIGGTVSGLTGPGLILQDELNINDSDLLPVSANGSFTFVNPVASGNAYDVTVLTQPAGRNCSVNNGSGTASANVTNVTVACVGDFAWIGGSNTVGHNGGQSGVYGTLGTPDPANIPGGRFGIVTWNDASGNVWLFSGDGYDSTGAQGYLNDLWKYTPGANGSAGEWTWMGGSSTVGSNFGQAGIYGTLGTPDPANIPGGREQALSWTDASGNFWLFGGYGEDSTGVGYGGQLNDLWKYTPGANATAGVWTWMGGTTVAPASTTGGANGSSGVYGTLGTAATTNLPGGREQMVSWTDASGDLWIFGGEGIDAYGVTGELNDLWKFDPKLGSYGEWTWMGGSNSVGSPFLFLGPSGVYGTLGTPDPANIPGGRYGAVSWHDGSGNVWLFGGSGIDSTGTYGYLNDLWEYTPGTNSSAGEWTWMGGSSTIPSSYSGQSGVYGTLGIQASSNIPGGREAAVSWTDAHGDVWLFGGLGIDSTGSFGYLNDTWKYTPGANGAAGGWTWVGGDNKVGPAGGQPGVYGALGTPATTNNPGGRYSPAGWVDASGNLWLFGGSGYDSTGAQGYLNDLWQYQP